MAKILVVDDSILNLTVLYRILKPDFQVVTCKNGEDALTEAAQNPPDLILLDVILQGIGGFEVLNRLKADPRTRDIPVIIITGLEGPSYEEQALQVGAVDFIQKPFRPRVVLARVHTHVELYHLRQNAEHLAMFDGLTAIPNRRSFDRQFQELADAALRDGLPFSAALSDIDFFKAYNDHYGHPAGDDAIRAVALTLHQTLLPLGGFAARYGGEEYAFLLPRYPVEPAERIAVAFQKNVESLAIPSANSAAASVVTISVGGVTVTPDYQGSLTGILETADKMLYKAKSSGRNCVRWTVSGAL